MTERNGAIFPGTGDMTERNGAIFPGTGDMTERNGAILTGTGTIFPGIVRSRYGSPEEKDIEI